MQARHDSHGVIATGRDGGHVLKVVVIRILVVGKAHLRGHSNIAAGDNAQLAFFVTSPSKNHAISPERHGIVSAGGNLNNAAQIGIVTGGNTLHHLYRGVTHIVMVSAHITNGDLLVGILIARVTLAQLTVGVIAKGPDISMVVQQQGMTVTGCHIHDLYFVFALVVRKPGQGNGSVVGIVVFGINTAISLVGMTQVVTGVGLPLLAGHEVLVEILEAGKHGGGIVGACLGEGCAGVSLEYLAAYVCHNGHVFGGIVAGAFRDILDNGLVVSVFRLVEASLTIGVIAPGIHITGSVQRHCMVRPCCNADNSRTAGDKHLLGSVVCHTACGQRRCAGVGLYNGGSVSLSGKRTPNIDLAVSLQRHGAGLRAHDHRGGDPVTGHAVLVCVIATNRHAEHRDNIAVGIQSGNGRGADLLEAGIGGGGILNDPGAVIQLTHPYHAFVGGQEGITGVSRGQVDLLRLYTGSNEVKAAVLIAVGGSGIDGGKLVGVQAPPKGQLAKAACAALLDVCAGKAKLHHDRLMLTGKIGHIADIRVAAALGANGGKAQLALAVVAPGHDPAVFHHHGGEASSSGNNRHFV